MVQRASASQKRLNEFLNTQPDITSPKNALHPNIKGQIRLENVSFTYEHTGIQAIQNINLEIQPGEKIAIVGRTGSGKTTLAQLLLRFFDPQTGNIKIDGLDLRSLDLYGLRDQVAYISQEVFLFSETVANNIRFGKNVSQEELKRAAQYASVEEDILRLPNQFETMVGERGVTLSGGQKQRVAIARALAKDSQVMILDDCLSAVDAKTEKQILASLTKVLAGKTAIIITHRIFSLLKFDKIIVMEEGKIVEQGTHEELLALNGYYSDMFNRQLRTEEDQ
jgi:ATP-binding cassette subfamily B protein